MCNNIEVSDKYSKNKNIAYEDKIELLKTIKQGLLAQANEMEKQGNKVNEIRIGMCRNDLSYFIEKEQYKIVKDNLFENYRFNRYQGDANNKAFGQAIIYKK